MTWGGQHQWGPPRTPGPPPEPPSPPLYLEGTPQPRGPIWAVGSRAPPTPVQPPPPATRVPPMATGDPLMATKVPHGYRGSPHGHRDPLMATRRLLQPPGPPHRHRGPPPAATKVPRGHRGTPRATGTPPGPPPDTGDRPPSATGSRLAPPPGTLTDTGDPPPWAPGNRTAPRRHPEGNRGWVGGGVPEGWSHARAAGSAPPPPARRALTGTRVGAERRYRDAPAALTSLPRLFLPPSPRMRGSGGRLGRRKSDSMGRRGTGSDEGPPGSQALGGARSKWEGPSIRVAPPLASPAH